MSESNEVARNEGIADATNAEAQSMPKVDIYESPDEVVVLCDMPGVKPADVDLEFERGTLYLMGKVTKRTMPGRCISEEYDIGTFSRAFSMNSEIDTTKIAAECSDGVVTLHLPKKESTKPKHIAVHHAAEM